MTDIHESIYDQLHVIRMRGSFEIRETAIRLIALLGIYTKDTITPAIMYLKHQGQEEQILAKAMEDILKINE
jgi:hypothetical protein